MCGGEEALAGRDGGTILMWTDHKNLDYIHGAKKPKKAGDVAVVLHLV